MNDKTKQASVKAYYAYRNVQVNNIEADEELFNANKELIEAMEEEHPGKLVFFKWWPKNGEQDCVPYVHGKTKIYNFCANLAIPSDSEHYGEFLSAVKRLRHCGHNNENLDLVCYTAMKCDGSHLFWS